MDDPRIGRLQALAKSAVRISEEIDKLQSACPYKTGVSVSYKDCPNGDPILSMDLLKEMMEAGRLFLLDKKKKELESIILDTLGEQ